MRVRFIDLLSNLVPDAEAYEREHMVGVLDEVYLMRARRILLEFDTTMSYFKRGKIPINGPILREEGNIQERYDASYEKAHRRFPFMFDGGLYNWLRNAFTDPEELFPEYIAHYKALRHDFLPYSNLSWEDDKWIFVLPELMYALGLYESPLWFQETWRSHRHVASGIKYADICYAKGEMHVAGYIYEFLSVPEKGGWACYFGHGTPQNILRAKSLSNDPRLHALCDSLIPVTENDPTVMSALKIVLLQRCPNNILSIRLTCKAWNTLILGHGAYWANRLTVPPGFTGTTGELAQAHIRYRATKAKKTIVRRLNNKRQKVKKIREQIVAEEEELKQLEVEKRILLKIVDFNYTLKILQIVQYFN
jgi:hypothetical protein